MTVQENKAMERGTEKERGGVGEREGGYMAGLKDRIR